MLKLRSNAMKISAIAIAVVAMLLVGCSRDDGKVHISYWEKWTGREGEAMQRTVDQFNRLE